MLVRKMQRVPRSPKTVSKPSVADLRRKGRSEFLLPPAPTPPHLLPSPPNARAAPTARNSFHLFTIHYSLPPPLPQSKPSEAGSIGKGRRKERNAVSPALTLTGETKCSEFLLTREGAQCAHWADEVARVPTSLLLLITYKHSSVSPCHGETEEILFSLVLGLEHQRHQQAEEHRRA